jgi:hypothetical protein
MVVVVVEGGRREMIAGEMERLAYLFWVEDAWDILYLWGRWRSCIVLLEGFD